MTRSPHLHPSPKVLAPVPNLEAAKELESLRNVFKEMDVSCTGRVSQKQFSSYLQRNPTGWPLADLLQGQSAATQKQIVTFWFRKLDIDGEGSFTETELVTFFEAMRNSKLKETLYADFLLNLFDSNFDAKLDRSEYANMLRVLLGKEPPKATIESISQDGLGRDDLVKLLHSIHCDLNLLGVAHDDGNQNKAKRSGDVITTIIVVVGVFAAAALVARYALHKKR